MAEIIVAKHSGFCFGVSRAIDLAKANSGERTFTFGEIIHNKSVVEELAREGVLPCEDLSLLKRGDTLVIRSHGAPKSVFDFCEQNGIRVVDATCPFVAKLQKTVHEAWLAGKKVVIVGDAEHPEIVGVNGWCENSATVIDGINANLTIPEGENVCVVVQTTFPPKKFAELIENIRKDCAKTVEVFETICYTTSARQEEAMHLAENCDGMVVIGDRHSANTRKLFEEISKRCPCVAWVQSSEGFNLAKFMNCKKIGIVAGASAPKELIMEVKVKMEENLKQEVQTQENVAGEVAAKADEEISMDQIIQNMDKTERLRKGQIIKGIVMQVNQDGVLLSLGSGKTEVNLPKEEFGSEEFDKDAFVVGNEIEVKVVSNTGKLLVSRKALEQDKIDEERIAEIRNGAEFTMAFNIVNKGGLKGKMGSYSVFVPGSQIKIGFLNEKDFEKYKGKTLRLQVLKVDDEKKDIVASQRVILEREKAEADEKFWSSIEVGNTVVGKVLRFSKFGAFVSVNGYDCLAHISDLSWKRIKTCDEVLELGKEYEFVVLKADRESGKVSIGYKQLQLKPIEEAKEKYPIGTVIEGKVARIFPFGAFVEIEPGLDGLVHISQVSNTYVDDVNKVLKVGDIVNAKVTDIDTVKEKISLSIKATLPEIERPAREEKEERKEEAPKARKPRAPKVEDDGPTSWTDSDSGSVSIAEMLGKH